VNGLERTSVIVPCRDESAAVGAVVAGLRAAGARDVIVVDNGSRDETATVAARAGARVVREERPGYGWACLAGVRAAPDAEIVAFMDGDGSFAAADVARLTALVAGDDADLALGARRTGAAFPIHQRAGNAVTLALLHLFYGLTLADLAPLRVVRGEFLRSLDMRGSRYAWLLEMLCKAARRDARIAVVPIDYRPRRGGRSKVTGSLRASLFAGADFLRALWELRAW
jgi:glycosyltransferase involved in cell wall biosynthesis